MRRLALVFIGLLLGLTVNAQRYFGVSEEEFGRTKIQSRTFQWRNFSSANFQYNFYRGGEQITKNAAEFLEAEYPRITDILGYIPFEQVRIFVFNSRQDVDATNLSSFSSDLNRGAIIDMKNSRILTAFDKNDSLFHQQLIYHVTTVFVNEMLFGGNFRESVENQILLNLPEWFVAGISAYVAEKDNSMMYDDFKTAIIEAQNQRLGNIHGGEAAKIGQSIWHYIELKYGKNSIANILNLTRVIHDEQSSITSTLGISFPRFLKEWRDFYVLGTPIVEEEEIVVIEEEAEVVLVREIELKEGEVNTDHYLFDEKNIELYESSLSMQLEEKISEPQTARRESLSGGEAKFSPVKAFNNFLVISDPKVDIISDPVRQFGLGYTLKFNDLLQNNVFQLSTYLRPTTPLFKTYDLDLSYGYYAKKTNLRFNYIKRSINLESIDYRDGFLFRPLNHVVADDRPEYLYRRLVSQTFSASIIYPLSKNIKVTISPSMVRNDDVDYALSRQESVLSDFYFAPIMSLVFDNVSANRIGVETGTRAKFSLNNYYHTSDNKKGSNNYYFDIRHYQRIINGLLFSGRVSYGSSGGARPQYTFLGGMENTVNRETYQSNMLLTGGNSDLKNILFYNFPGNLRGFEFGRLYGNNHMLVNLELRTYLGEFLPQAALSSRFVRDFQIVGFFDIGTAWLGKSGPFSRQNSLNTTMSDHGPFKIEVTNFKDPFLSGTGLGVRTSIFGIFVKADYGFGIEDKSFNGSQLYLSVGKDF